MPEIDNKPPRLYQKTKDAIAMVTAGLDARTALKYANFKDNISDRQVIRLNKKVRKYSLTSPSIIKLAHKAIKDCLNDVPINGNIFPTYSNKIAIAGMAYDRFEPVKSQQTEANQVITHIDFSVINNNLGVDLGVCDNKDVIDVK